MRHHLEEEVLNEMQVVCIGWNRNLTGGRGNSEKEGSYGRACDISMAVISRSHILTKIQPTLHGALQCTWKYV